MLTILPAAEANRPNIIFIFSDDHAPPAISAYGDRRKLIRTPNIDRIAKEGMRFDRCLVVNSICGPSRATVLTGKYSHKNGFYNNTNSRFDGSQVTVPKLLQATGYQTALKQYEGPRPEFFVKLGEARKGGKEDGESSSEDVPGKLKNKGKKGAGKKQEISTEE